MCRETGEARSWQTRSRNPEIRTREHRIRRRDPKMNRQGSRELPDRPGPEVMDAGTAARQSPRQNL